MVILFTYISAIAPERGGIERVTETLADYFELCEHRCFYLAMTTFNAELCNSPRQFYLPASAISDGFLPDAEIPVSSENSAFFQRFLSEKKITIVINQFSTGNPFLFAKECAASGVKVVSVFHNDPFYFRYAPAKSFLQKIIRPLRLFLKTRWHKKFFSREYKQVAKFVLLSETFREPLAKLAGDNSKIAVIPDPLPPAFENALNSQPPAKQKIALFVGRLSIGQKRTDLLLRAWALIEEKFSDWKLQIAGDGPDRGTLEKLAGDLSLKNVEFLGFCDPIPHYKNAAVFCLTSAFEGFGMVLFEASAFGCAPVVFKYLSSENLINNGENGILVEQGNVTAYADALVTVLSNENYRQKIAVSARENARRFSVKNIAEQWLTLLPPPSSFPS